MWKSVLVGVLVALLVVAVAAVSGYLYVQSANGLRDVHPDDRVVLIFESPAEDGATVAALIATVADGRMRDVPPETSVTVPGTTYKSLSDAFVFGGGAAVAESLAGSSDGGRTVFVAVPAATWTAALDTTTGVSVNVPQKVTVFDGAALTTIPSGEQTLTAAQVTALLRGLPYVGADGSSGLRRELERQLAAALIASGPQAASLETDLSPKALESWLRDYLGQAVIGQVE